MRKTKLIDMSGLSGDPSSDDQLDELFFRLESEIPDAPRKNSKRIYLASYIPMQHLTGISMKRAAVKIGIFTRRMTKVVARSTTSGRVMQ